MAAGNSGNGETDVFRFHGPDRGEFAHADWALAEGRHLAIIGGAAAASGVCAWIAAQTPVPHGFSIEYGEGVEEHVEIVSFAQQRAAAGRNGFPQGRYHSLVDDAGPGDTVADVLSFERIYDVNPFEVGVSRVRERRQYACAYRRVARWLELEELRERRFLALSNGETRRVLIARSLLACPKLLVLDDPNAGLDAVGRERVKSMCAELASAGVTLVVAVRHEDEIPACVSDVLNLQTGKMEPWRPRGGGRAAPGKIIRTEKAGRKRRANPDTFHDSGRSSPPVVELRDIRMAFGRRTLFDGFGWVVRRGEHWVLKGANGSGKTTLLSLITGDNPKAYANDVTVFGLKREPGVELARIRRRIGMVSPEGQAYTGLGAEELLEAALGREIDLLILDEPCLNLDAASSARLRRRVASWLRAHPRCAAICVAHRPDDVPPGFPLVVSLGY